MEKFNLVQPAAGGLSADEQLALDPTICGPVRATAGDAGGNPIVFGATAARREAEIASDPKMQAALGQLSDVQRALYEIEYKSKVSRFGTMDTDVALSDYMFSRAVDDGVFGSPGQLPANW